MSRPTGVDHIAIAVPDLNEATQLANPPSGTASIGFSPLMGEEVTRKLARSFAEDHNTATARYRTSQCCQQDITNNIII